MTGAVQPKRLAALIVGLLAVLGLSWHGPPAVSVPGAGFPMAFCHAGADDRRPVDHGSADCDGCLLCAALHGDQAGTPLLPVGPGVPPISVAVVVRPLAGVERGAEWEVLRGSWARAPPDVV